MGCSGQCNDGGYYDNNGNCDDWIDSNDGGNYDGGGDDGGDDGGNDANCDDDDGG